MRGYINISVSCSVGSVFNLRFVAILCQHRHIEIGEGDKEATNMMALGKTLKIKDKTYTELDEIVATYLNPLIHMTSEVLDSKKFQPTSFDEAGKH